jgi:hypothetical protein
MEPQQLLTEVTATSAGACNKTEKKGIYLRRWMLWILLVVCASLLYIFDIGVELRYRMALPQSIIPSE